MDWAHSHINIKKILKIHRDYRSYVFNRLVCSIIVFVMFFFISFLFVIIIIMFVKKITCRLPWTR